MEKKTYCTSLNEEIFSEEFDSKEEAIKYMNDDLDEGDVFYVGEKELITKGDVAACCNFDWESPNMNMCDEVGEVAEDWLAGISKEEWGELNGIIADWLWKKDKPSFYKVKNVEQFVVKK